ncbi:Rho GTPase-activating protein 7 [Sesamum alatum]|uniref:Rho GTPase-activating protein 7 n=1 Tax=Sesamum alatum TaxID=300844 RepID=A0AAE2CEW4_9LAMI|nr:Rho GTPase-activating protein 7 [Sesamum alatum]
MSASLAAFERPRVVNSNTIFKSGHLLISSKGLGWKSWKKRWFILTRTSLVFFKNDPSALPQRGGEVNLTLGGIDLNNSGSVVVREDKKLLTVLFPDGRDGRAFTLKAETLEDLYEWKTALEHALAQAPNAALVMGHNGIFRSDTNDPIEGSFHQWRDKRPVKSLVVGRPILLALEDIDGGPSFLEKALRFLEKYGIKVEGILRQAADVEEVERRVQEYEQGKTEFGPDEDAHVIGDCVKHVLRELPSSPVPASCCTALLEAYKIDRKEARVNAMQSAIHETFPEPNRRLLQRILKMMHTISSHASENRMTPSAVAACMAPLLLRPLLAGECELEDDYDVNGDNSAQLLAAANAANNAQAIITTLLEEYENIFDDDSMNRCSLSADSQSASSRSEDMSDDENPDINVNGYHDAENEVDPEVDYDRDRRLSGKLSESSGSAASDLYEAIGNDDSDDGSSTHNGTLATKRNPTLDSRPLTDPNLSVNEQLDQQKKACENMMDASAEILGNESQRSMGDILSSMDQELNQSSPGPELLADKPMPKLTNSSLSAKKSTFWGRKNARRTPSTESIDSSGEEELAIQRLEIVKNDLRQRIAKEARGNAILQASLERRKQALHERRLALEQDVARLQEQLQAERDLRAALEVGLSMSSGQFSGSRGMDSKTRAELEEIALAEADVARLKQKVAELHHQLNQQRQHHYGLSDAIDRYQHAPDQSLQQKYFQQDFDTTLAVCNHERKQRTEEFLGAEPRTTKGQLLTSGSRQPSRKQLMESTSPAVSKSSEASTSIDNLCAVDSASVPSTSRVPEVMEYPQHPTAASSTLVELTTRLDFFKERRSQLMEQLHNLDLNYGSSPQDFVYKLSSPPWN